MSPLQRPSRFRPGRAGLVLGLVCLLPCGCKKPAPQLVQVKGRVEVYGRMPRTALVVVFHPISSDSQAAMPSAVVQAGDFEVRCLPGRYKATVMPLHATAEASPTQGMLAAAGSLTPFARNEIPPAYLQATSSPWNVTIPAQDTTDLVLPIK